MSQNNDQIRVRLAPSPTGLLHVGTARTALYNYAFAKNTGGKFIIRVEDTDQERSKKEWEVDQLKDLEWLNLKSDESPEKDGGYGPYRQSERLSIYKKYVDKLINEEKAFYCFCKADELEKKKEELMAKNLAPHYDGTCRKLPINESKKRVEDGEEYTVRFIAPDKEYSFDDLVRGKVSFPSAMVGDFIIQRSDGHPVYNFCCVIDDFEMKITHVIRGEDHVNNTLRQLMIYEGINAEFLPEFCHTSMILGSDGKKLSKRHGATSVGQYKEEGYLSEGLVNYLALLGWSHPEEVDVFSIEEMIEKFSLNRFSKSPAIFDVEKLNYINSQQIKKLELSRLVQLGKPFINDQEKLQNLDNEWINEFFSLFQEKVSTLKDFNNFFEEIFIESIEENDDVKDVNSWETTPIIREYFQSEIEKKNTDFLSSEEFNEMSNFLKKEKKIKGKNLFMGMRVVLTGKTHGSDLSRLIPLTPIKHILKRLS